MAGRKDPFLSWVDANITIPAWERNINDNGDLNKEGALTEFKEIFRRYPSELEVWNERGGQQAAVKRLNEIDKAERKNRRWSISDEETGETYFEIRFPGWEDVEHDRVTYYLAGEKIDRATLKCEEQDLEAVVEAYEQLIGGMQHNVAYYRALLAAVRAKGVRTVEELYNGNGS